MTVYVDDLFKYAMGQKQSHMIAENEKELHSMARRIGVGLQAYKRENYYVSLDKRKLAVQRGAVEIDLRTCGVMVANRRAGWPMGDPKTCITISQQRTEHERVLGDLL